MTGLVETQRARGMRDLLPDDMQRVRAVEDAFGATCRAWGYREIRTPVVEPLHLFTAAGTLSPQTLDRVYSFLDWDGWSGERVVLRPDSTIPAARLYAEGLRGGLAKLFYRQSVFRFTDDGSSREEPQCGVELIGETGMNGDVELVLLALGALEAMQLTQPPTVRLSHAGIVRAVLRAAGLSAEEQSEAYDRLLDGDMSVVDEVEARLPQLDAALRLLFNVEGTGRGYVTNLRRSFADALPQLLAPLDELAFVVRVLDALGVTPRIEAVLARSFEYYSGIVTRYDINGRRIGGGGRYDDLLREMGGANVRASGFALDVDALGVHVHNAEPSADRVLVETDGETPDLVAARYEAARRLRAAGVLTDTIASADGARSRLHCQRGGPYTLTGPRGVRSFERLDDVVDGLEQGG